MLISLDYDDTFSADPDFWRKFIESAKAHGHAVICITSRFESFENRRELESATGLKVIFCEHNYKRETAEKLGHRVDVWIDDCPEGIGKPLPLE